MSTHKANHHEVTLVQPPLIGDRAYDSEGLENDLKQDGVNLMRRTAPPGHSRPKTAGLSVALNAAGSSSGSWPGSNRNGGC